MKPQELTVVDVKIKNGVPALFFNYNCDRPTYWQYLFGIPASPFPTDSKLQLIYTKVFLEPKYILLGKKGIEFPGETWELSKEVGSRKRRQVWTRIKNLEAKVKDQIILERRLIKQLKNVGATPEKYSKLVAELSEKGHHIEAIYPPKVMAIESLYKNSKGSYKALLPDIREFLSKEKKWPSPSPWHDTGTSGQKEFPNFVASLKGGTTFGEVEGLKVTFLWSSGADPMSRVLLTTCFYVIKIDYYKLNLSGLPGNHHIVLRTSQLAFRNIITNRMDQKADKKNREAVRRKLVELAQKYVR